MFAYPRSSAFICGYLFSFVPQRNAGLYPARPARRKGRGKQGHAEHRRHGKKYRGRVARRHPEQQAGDEASQCEGGAPPATRSTSQRASAPSVQLGTYMVPSVSARRTPP